VASRLKLQEELVVVLGSNNVDFQPPSSHIMKYPCIIYNVLECDSKYANNKMYANTKRYQVTLISEDPDLDVFDKIIDNFPMCKFDRHFVSANLNHEVFDIYY